MDEASDRFGRCRVLPAYVQIMLATHEVAVARKAAAELFKIAEELEAPFLRAGAAYAQGAVTLAEGDPAGALTPLRRALSILGQTETPYEQLGYASSSGWPAGHQRCHRERSISLTASRPKDRPGQHSTYDTWTESVGSVHHKAAKRAAYGAATRDAHARCRP